MATGTQQPEPTNPTVRIHWKESGEGCVFLVCQEDGQHHGVNDQKAEQVDTREVAEEKRKYKIREVSSVTTSSLPQFPPQVLGRLGQGAQ